MAQHSMSGPITVSVNANGEISLSWPTSLDFGGGVISALSPTFRTSTRDEEDDPQQLLCETCAEVLGIPDSLARALCAAVPREGA